MLFRSIKYQILQISQPTSIGTSDQLPLASERGYFPWQAGGPGRLRLATSPVVASAQTIETACSSLSGFAGDFWYSQRCRNSSATWLASLGLAAHRVHSTCGGTLWKKFEKGNPTPVGPGFIGIHSRSKNPLFITSGKQSFIFSGPQIS